MEHENLYELIQYLSYGTQLHIGVLFFDDYGNERCKLPHAHSIHSGAICKALKDEGRRSFQRCFACRNLAIQKAMRTKKAFGGLCINGIYEYTHPVVMDGEVVCMIYIGNILEEGTGREKLCRRLGEKVWLLETLETDFPYGKCAAVGGLVEGYIRFLLEKYGLRDQKGNPVVENIKNYVMSNLEFDIDVSHITRLFHYNKQYLGRVFKKETGLSIKEYIAKQRLDMARKLIAGSDDTITDIASRVGFHNVTYFNRQFKGRYHMTPTQYRKEQRSK